MEPKCRYWEKGEVDESAPPSGLFDAAVRRDGTDATLVAYGPSVKTCLKAAEAAAAEGRSLEVIDLRSISPLDVDTVAALRREDRPAHRRARGAGLRRGWARRSPRGSPSGASTRSAAPPLRVGGYHTPYPPSRVEEDYLPNVDRLLDALDRSFEF